PAVPGMVAVPEASGVTAPDAPGVVAPDAPGVVVPEAPGVPAAPPAAVPELPGVLEPAAPESEAPGVGLVCMDAPSAARLLPVSGVVVVCAYAVPRTSGRLTVKAVARVLMFMTTSC